MPLSPNASVDDRYRVLVPDAGTWPPDMDDERPCQPRYTSTPCEGDTAATPCAALLKHHVGGNQGSAAYHKLFDHQSELDLNTGGSCCLLFICQTFLALRSTLTVSIRQDVLSCSTGAAIRRPVLRLCFCGLLQSTAPASTCYCLC